MSQRPPISRLRGGCGAGPQAARDQAVSRPQAVGADQHERHPLPRPEARTCWLIENEHGQPVGTVTLDSWADPQLWHPDDEPAAALYLHRLMVADAVRGSELGSAVLDLASLTAATQSRRWLRLDACTTNAGLHRYYLDRGFGHIRTVEGDGIVSGALFERDAGTTLDHALLLQTTDTANLTRNTTGRRALRSLIEAISRRPSSYAGIPTYQRVSMLLYGIMIGRNRNEEIRFQEWMRNQGAPGNLQFPEQALAEVFPAVRRDGRPLETSEDEITAIQHLCKRLIEYLDDQGGTTTSTGA